MIKKFVAIFIVLLCFLGITNVEAKSESNFIDIQSYSNIYKLSEDSEVKLPFIKVFNEKASVDKVLNKSGIIFGAKAVEIVDETNGIQTIVSADTVDIKGRLEYGMILAPNVVISGTVEKDIFILAESVFITETANILGDIIVMANEVEMNGTVKGNFIGNSTEFLMNGNVDKDFRVYSQNITFDKTDIKGDIYIETDSDLDIATQYKNATVNKIQSNVVTEAERKNQIIETAVSVITAVVLFTLLNMIIRKIKPEMFKNISKKVVEHSSFTVIMGVLLLVTIPIITILTVICSMVGLGVVTTPLFIAYIALVIVTITLAKFIVGSVLYELLKNKIKADGIIKEIGLLLGIFAGLHIVCYIPLIAWFATMAIVLFSAGFVMTGMLKRK